MVRNASGGQQADADDHAGSLLWRGITYALHSAGALYAIGALRDLHRAWRIQNAPVVTDLAALDDDIRAHGRSRLVQIRGTIRSPAPIESPHSTVPVVILSHVTTGRYVSYYGALQEMFLSQDVRVAPFYLGLPFPARNASDQQLWINSHRSASMPRFFCSDLLNTVSEKTDAVRPFAASFVSSLLGIRLPFENIERVSVLPVDCDALVVAHVTHDSVSSRLRIAVPPWWSLYPPSITAVTTSAAETLVEVMHESAIDRAITGALFFAAGALCQYLRAHQS
ncbi:Uncharacterized protein PBTT_00950 [Plasmodiophora brassicae]|nr:hypothetical protein PBRA_006975 [Plasmodiophora brassicae]